MTTTPAVPGYPFTAVVGQEQLRLALLLNAVDPGIGGVCIRGEKGTAKTTMVRGIAPLLDGPLVNLPLGATEDRVVGSIDVETVLTTGRATYQPGLLAQANKGVLYVDEVNLLADHLVDSLLDAAATGRVTVERDGISYSSPASFVLVGTMNPEEGELRPQLLDRFGLAVMVAASKDPEERAEIVARRLDYDADPHAFARRFEDSEQAVAEQLRRARRAVASVELPRSMLISIAQLCAAFDVDGLRADIVIARTATAHAAWCGRDTVTDEDIRIAARLALPHRQRRNPFDEPELNDDELQEKLDEALQRDEPETDPDPSDSDPDQSDNSEPTEGPETPPSSDRTPADSEGERAAQGAKFRRSLDAASRLR